MIALDTGVLLYGVQAARGSQRRVRSDVEEGYIRRAAALIDELRLSGKRLMLPAPAAWEYVTDFAVEDQPDIWASFKDFALIPFDQSAARIAARLARRHFDEAIKNSKGQGKKVIRDQGPRQLIKVDMQILAVAIAHRAEKIYTFETERFTHWADGLIQVAGPPGVEKRLFDPSNPP